MQIKQGKILENSLQKLHKYAIMIMFMEKIIEEGQMNESNRNKKQILKIF